MLIKKSKHYNITVMISLFMPPLLLLIVSINYLSLKAFGNTTIKSLVSLDSLLFLLLGLLFLNVFAYLAVSLSHYKVGKLFASYTLLTGLSISLAPCTALNPAIDLFYTMSSLTGSFLLFMTFGQLTLLNKKALFHLFKSLLLACMVIGTLSQSLHYNDSVPLWAVIFSEDCINVSILLCIVGSLTTMGVHYHQSNAHSRKQIKILVGGIAGGGIIFLWAYLMPYIGLVHTTSVSDIPVTFELALEPTSVLIHSLPLLLFSGVSIAILLVLFKRGFVPTESRLKLWHFILTAIYLFCVNAILFIYPVFPVAVFISLHILLFIPLILLYGKVLKLTGNNESVEDAYRWKLLEDLEQERQQLSVFLHDEVLQLLIAFYRQLQADKAEQYPETKEQLSKMIAQVRGVSHHLYPTVVEDLGLEQSLLLLVSELKISYPDIKIIYDYHLTEGILPKTVALPFYRIVRELVNNAAKHANGTEIMFSLSEDINGYYIHVKDNGQGFTLPDNNTLILIPHMGIYTVKKQISKLHGQISFYSDKTSGTDYHIFIPAKEGLKNAD